MCRCLCLSIPILMILISIAIVTLLPSVVKIAIRERFALVPESELYQRWVQLPVPLKFKIYLFEVVNPNDVLRGQAPIVRERGPYFFYQHRYKKVLNFSRTRDRVSYLEYRKYIFDRNLSIGPLTDQYTIVNLPAVAVSKIYSEFVDKLPIQLLTRPVLMAFMSSLLDIHRQNLFVRKTVGEIMFDGYKLDFVETLNTIAAPLEMLGFKFPINQGFPNNRFAIYLGRNNTPLGPYEVYTGYGDKLTETASKKTGLIYKWQNKTTLNWYGGACNSLRGTDGTRFPPFVKSSQDLSLLSSEACRMVKMSFTRNVNESGIPAYRFELGSQQFLKPSINPDNWCYCQNRTKLAFNEIDPCKISGLIDLSKCWFGAPLLASKPHFYQMDANLGNATIRNMRPNADKHESFVHVEPNTGLVLHGARRIQLNIKVKKHANFPNLRLINNQLLIPLLWLDEEGQINQELEDEIKGRLLLPLSMAKMGSIILFVVGFVVLIVACLCSCLCKKRKKERVKAKKCCFPFCCFTCCSKKSSKVEDMIEDDKLKLVGQISSQSSVTSSNSADTQITQISNQSKDKQMNANSIELSQRLQQPVIQIPLSNWQQMYDFNLMTNYLNQLYLERQYSESNIPMYQMQSGLVQLHPFYLNALNSQVQRRSSVDTVNPNNFLALPPVENESESEVVSKSSTKSIANASLPPLQLNANEFKLNKQTNNSSLSQSTANERFVFGQPPITVQSESIERREEANEENIETDQAYDVLDVFDDSFDDEIEDGRYSATMFNTIRSNERAKVNE